jgi:hypothetical protein
MRLQELRITLSILQKTGIGKTVDDLQRIIPNEDLSNVAKCLLQNWKKLVPGLSTSFLRKSLSAFVFTENSSVLIKKKDKQPTMTIIYENQQLEEINTCTRENIERQPSQSASSSYTTSQPLAALTAEVCLIRFLFIQKFSVASEKEMASDTLKEERTKLHESAINEHQLATDEGTDTDLIQCPR